MAWGAIAGGILGMMAANRQASAMEDTTRSQIGLQREQFDYARNLQEALLQQQEPRRQSSQRAMRSLSMLMGLGDPGGSAPAVDLARLERLKGELGDTSPTIGGATVRGQRPGEWQGQKGGTGARIVEASPAQPNPEFARLEEEISALEAELAGGVDAADDFEGPAEITEMPGFQFAMDQGLEALASSGSARGMQLSGRQMEDITEFGQGTAMSFRGQLMEELGAMAGLRPSTAPITNLSNLATGEAGAVSPLLGQQGMISAAKTAGQFGNLGAILSNPALFQGGNTTGGGTTGFQGVAAATPRRF